MTDPLAGLDEAGFSALQDAYGPAVDTPGQLRGIAAGDAAALDALIAGAFHQGSYYSATAPAAAFLVRLATSRDVALRAPVLRLLAELTGGLAAPQLDWDPLVFRSTPGPPDYPEALATVAVVRDARPALEDALADPEPAARVAAALVLAGIGDPASRPALDAATRRETDALVRAAMVFATGKLGGPSPEHERDADERVAACAVAARVTADGVLRDGDLAQLAGLVLARSVDEQLFPWRDGEPAVLAVEALFRAGEHAPADVVRALRLALEVRLHRGERLPAPPSGNLQTVDETADTPSVAYSHRAGVVLRSLAGALAPLAFASFVGRKTNARLDELDEPQRALLTLTRDHGIALGVPGIPWISREAMARFLSGGGPLDTLLTVRGETAPAHAWLPRVSRRDTPEDLRADILAAIAAWTPDALFDLAVDVLDGSYANPGSTVLPGEGLLRVLALLAPHDAVLAPKYAAYLERLAAAPEPTPMQARFALRPSLSRAASLPDGLDALLRLAIAGDVAAAPAWVAALPEPRRSRVVGGMGNAFLRGKLAALCDPETLARASMDAFLAPGCRWWLHDAGPTLAAIEPLSVLKEALSRATGRRRALLERAILDREGASEHSLIVSASTDGDGLSARLVDPRRARLAEATLTRAPLAEELAPLVSMLPPGAVVRIETELDHSTTYRLQRLLSELGVREVIAGGSTMRRGP